MSAAMPGVVTFEARADGFTAMLGVWPIGVIQTAGGRDARASWQINLPGASPFWNHDPSIDAAKDRFTRRVMEWIDAARLAPALPIDGVIRASIRATDAAKGVNDGRQTNGNGSARGRGR